jgi:DnaJ-class molecular chaperone
MSHASNIVHCTGPHDPHALDGISVRHRSGDLDVRCPVCAGHGQWNSQIDLISHRSIRVPCPKCDGRGSSGG